MEFEKFSKIPRLSRDCVITEKIDGTNGQIYIPSEEDLLKEGPLVQKLRSNPLPFLVGSRNRWIQPTNDNYGFAKWAYENAEELLKLGLGRHFGEWWGPGIQRRYGVAEKRFSLFNTKRWRRDEVPKLEKGESVLPDCCHVVPVLYEGPFTTDIVDITLTNLKANGSAASPGFMRPEGIVIYHKGGGYLFKKTIEGDEVPKGAR
jgi:hypothetical protein